VCWYWCSGVRCVWHCAAVAVAVICCMAPAVLELVRRQVRAVCCSQVAAVALLGQTWLVCVGGGSWSRSGGRWELCAGTGALLCDVSGIV
jgi:hypothetical protein